MKDIWEYSDVDGELGDILQKRFISAFRTGYIKSRGYVLPEYYKKFGHRVENLQVRNDDVWIVSFPKTGEYSYHYCYPFQVLNAV